MNVLHERSRADGELRVGSAPSRRERHEPRRTRRARRTACRGERRAPPAGNGNWGQSRPEASCLRNGMVRVDSDPDFPCDRIRTVPGIDRAGL
jgi:hypothetical protein